MARISNGAVRRSGVCEIGDLPALLHSVMMSTSAIPKDQGRQTATLVDDVASYFRVRSILSSHLSKWTCASVTDNDAPGECADPHASPR